MAIKVQFTLNLDDFMKKSGRYDNKQPQTREQVITMVGQIIQLGTDGFRTLRQVGAARIECSTDSFCKLLVARRDAGYINNFRGLDVELVEPSPRQNPLPLLIANN